MPMEVRSGSERRQKVADATKPPIEGAPFPFEHGTVGRAGIEPAAYGLRIRCSAWLS